MIKNVFTFLMIITFLSSCHQKSELATAFNCKQKISTSELKTIADIHKNYSISIPNHWKISYYFDENQSDIYVADTIKPLTSTYILNFSNKNGLLLLNDEFKKKIKQELTTDGLTIISDKQFVNKALTSYYIFSKGIKNQFPYHQIQLIKPLNETSFFDIKIEIYGDQLIEERICEAIHYTDLLQIR